MESALTHVLRNIKVRKEENALVESTVKPPKRAHRMMSMARYLSPAFVRDRTARRLVVRMQTSASATRQCITTCK